MASTASEGSTIVVTGQRIASGTGAGVRSGSAGRFLPREPIEGGDGGGGEVEMPCVDPDAFPPEERERVLVILEAAKVAREILEQPDRDLREYGSVIYRGADGRMRHTPIASGTPTSANVDTTGMSLEDFSNIYSLVHSHVALGGFNPSQPDARLYPTPDSSQPDGAGDWNALQGWANSAQSALISSELRAPQRANS